MYEELRNLAAERNLLMVTALQLNRSAVEEIEFDLAILQVVLVRYKQQIMLWVFLQATPRERGRYLNQFMKTRPSSGVGSKVDLKFDPDTLRIEDPVRMTKMQ